MVAFLSRTGPIVAFLITVSIVVNLCARAGVFEVLAGSLARFTSGRPWRLWFAVSGLTTVSTVVPVVGHGGGVSHSSGGGHGCRGRCGRETGVDQRGGSG